MKHRFFFCRPVQGVLLSLGLWLLSVGHLWAESSSEMEGVWRFSLRDAAIQGGWLMWVLAGMSVFALTLVVYFLLVLRRSHVVPRRLHQEVIDKIREGALNDARKLCEYKPCPLSTITLTAMDYLREAPDPDPSLLREILEGEGVRQAETLQGQPQMLLDVAVIAPMVGLLGTVFGMLKAFSGVAYQMESAKPVVLAEGVAQALVTTAFGLLVGIPAMMFFSYFRRRAIRLVGILEIASTSVLTALLGKKSS